MQRHEPQDFFKGDGSAGLSPQGQIGITAMGYDEPDNASYRW